uniref:Uncharacterized protein n=2 Tax=Anguilla anguilla TaxID=7936 RepID=A0A0E9SNB9_ANGAN
MRKVCYFNWWMESLPLSAPAIGARIVRRELFTFLQKAPFSSPDKVE